MKSFYTIYFFIVVGLAYSSIAFAQKNLPKVNIYIVNSPSGLFLRKHADINAKRITAVLEGKQIFSYDTPYRKEVEIDSIKGYWLKVFYLNMEGYMFSGYMEKVGEIDLGEMEKNANTILTAEQVNESTESDTVLTQKMVQDTVGLYELKLMSQQLLNQLKTLKKDTLVALSKADVEIELTDTMLFQNICNKKYREYFDDTLIKEVFKLKEYFYFNIDKKGRTVKIEDERTETNRNTKYFTAEDIAKLQQLLFSPAKRNDTLVNTKAPLGIDISVKRVDYKIKIKGEKIRLYRIPLFVEYINIDNPYYNVIMNDFKHVRQLQDGKYKITLLEGSYSFYVLSAKEYNPFYKKKRNLYIKDFYSIVEFISLKSKVSEL